MIWQADAPRSRLSRTTPVDPRETLIHSMSSPCCCPGVAGGSLVKEGSLPEGAHTDVQVLLPRAHWLRVTSERAELYAQTRLVDRRQADAQVSPELTG